ncbi:enzymatic polyprotein, putative [Rhizophagus irregularis DAOM 181602=DAOM 197198]|nr:enzymatic polyprotein, putative [Rhizophagus irregularis DAOM 181602=DAOM 197198]
MLNESKEEKFEKKTHLGEMSDEERTTFRKLIRKYEDIFEYDEEKLGRINTVKHEIIIEENQGPIAQKRYKETDEKGKFIKKEIEQLLKMGKIRESWSNWASPVTLAGKKTGNYRFCIDYRKLNNVTKSDEYPLPWIDELLEKFRKGSWFTSLNLAAGYHQVEMAEEDKEKTAFICSQGLYEYNVMPFGLKNAPGTFRRLMDKILKEYIGEFVTVYLDDIMIYSEDFEEHIEHVDKVLSKLRENNMIVKLKKCQFGLRNINFLGHIVGRDGLRPDKEKVEKIENMRRPKTVTEVRSFLGLCSYYRRFIKGFSKIAKPLLNLTKKNEKFEWKEEQQEAFDVLRTKLTENPILVYPDFSREFILITDGSKIGLGAVLAQMNGENKEVVIAYASRSTVGAEKNYPPTELECLAVFWGIQHFQKYLVGRKFIVITDHAALKGLTDGKEQTGDGNKWYNAKRFKGRWDDEKYFTDKEAILLNLEDKTEKEVLKKLERENKPQVIIIDGVDGLGKTSIVQNLIKEWEKQGLKVRFNTFKRRRKDKGEFHESKLETEWKFRKEVVEQINRRMLEYDEDTDIIILDKSPYCEYYYQKTKSFNRGLITPHGNHEMEKEIFRLKETIDKSIVIFLEKDGDVCWENYIGRETKKMEKSSYPTLKKNEYLDIVKMFKENQDVYKDTKRYSQIEVRNDNSSWRKVYKEIEKHQRA